MRKVIEAFEGPFGIKLRPVDKSLKMVKSLYDPSYGNSMGNIYKDKSGRFIGIDIYGYDYELSKSDAEWLINNKKPHPKNIKAVGQRCYAYDTYEEE